MAAGSITSANHTANGFVQVFSGANGTVIHTFYGNVVSKYPDYFGSSIAKAGDLDKDGHPDILVGAGHTSALYVFSGRTGKILLRVHDPNQTTNPALGHSVALVGDIDGDTYPDYVTGCIEGNLVTVKNSGEVRVYSGRTGNLIYRVLGLNRYKDNFGNRVCGGYDFDNDKVPDFMASSRTGSDNNYHNYAIVFSGASGKPLCTINRYNTNAIYIAMGNFDADQRGDLCVSNHSANTAGVLLGTYSSVPLPAITLSSPPRIGTQAILNLSSPGDTNCIYAMGFALGKNPRDHPWRHPGNPFEP